MSNFERLFAQKFGGTGEKIKELEGVLPLTFTSNGQSLLDYRIYGAVGGVGDDSSTAYGYVVPMSVQTEELRQDVEQGGWNGQNDGIVTSYDTGPYAPVRCRIGKFYVNRTKTYTISAVPNSLEIAVKAVRASNVQISDSGWVNTYTITPMGLTNWLSITIRKPDNSNIAPADVQCVKIITSETTTPIYIGSAPLGEGEYVSLKEQKIYRMSEGTLTPTDPPVPLPQIPTIKGKTVIDYDGTPKPSQMYIKYKS